MGNELETTRPVERRPRPGRTEIEIRPALGPKGSERGADLVQAPESSMPAPQMQHLQLEADPTTLLGDASVGFVEAPLAKPLVELAAGPQGAPVRGNALSLWLGRAVETVHDELSDVAAYQAVKATGADDKDVEHWPVTKVRERAQALLDTGVVTAGAKLSTIRDRAKKQREDEGEHIGRIFAKLDSYDRGRPLEDAARVHPARISARIQRELLDKLSPIDRAASPQYIAAIELYKHALDVELVPQGPIISFGQARSYEKKLRDQLNRAQVDEKAKEDLLDLVHDEIDKKALRMCQLIDHTRGDDPLYDSLVEARRMYGHMAETERDAESAIKDAKVKQYQGAANVALAAAGGLLTWALTHHPAATAAGAGAGGVVKPLVDQMRGYASQAMAAGIDKAGLFKRPKVVVSWDAVEAAAEPEPPAEQAPSGATLH